MKNLSLLLFALFTLFCSSIKAQELMVYQQPKEYEMPPKLIPTARKYWVSLPKGYDKDIKRYPIVFLFDGNEAYLRNLTLNTVDELTNFGAMPECIIVGLMQRNRALDFGPLYAIADNPNSAKVNGDKFLQFLKTELLPELDKNYRTQDFRVGIGHSLGGLFLTHSFTQQPDLFNGIVTISPALELQRDSIVFANLNQTLASKLNRQTYFCWASGTGDINEYTFKPGSVALSKLFKNVPNSLFTYKYIDLPGKNHSLTPLFSLPQALEFIFKEWNPHQWESAITASAIKPDDAITARTETIKRTYRFEPEPDDAKAFMFFKIGYMSIEEKKYQQAITYLKAAIKLKPESGYYRQLAKAYENLKDYNTAVNSLKTGIELLKKDEEASKWWLDNYEADLKRLQALAVSK